MDNKESLSDKLKSLGVQAGTSASKRPAKPAGYRVEDVIPGEVVSTPYGDTYRVEKWYDLEYDHGSIRLAGDFDLRIITEWGRVTHLAGTDPCNLLFLDTETTGLGGGTGTFAFLVGVGNLTPQGFHLVQYLLRSPAEEPALLWLLDQQLSNFAAVVTYNGKAFDAPLLRTRHILNGFDSPFTDLAHLDLLPLARRLWRNRLPSRSLGDLEVQIVGVERTEEEVPGWMIPELYFEYLRSRDARPLQGVMYHNGMDILSLAALFQFTSHLLADPLGYTTPQSLDLIAIARLYEELGLLNDAVRLYEFSLDLGLPQYFFLQTLQRFAELYRRQGDWEKTVLLWEKAAQHHQVEACIELAKYYEHNQRDYPLALQWTDSAESCADRYISSLASRQKWKEELGHRRARLARKLNGSARSSEK